MSTDVDTAKSLYVPAIVGLFTLMPVTVTWSPAMMASPVGRVICRELTLVVAVPQLVSLTSAAGTTYWLPEVPQVVSVTRTAKLGGVPTAFEKLVFGSARQM